MNSDNPPGADNQQESLSHHEALCWFLAGFIEGEGSVCISIKKHASCASGFYVDPNFFLYQHRIRRPILECARQLFGCGSINPKSGNPDVLVYAVTSTRALADRVVPFLEKYMTYSARRGDYEAFAQAVRLIDSRRNRTPDEIVEIVKLAYSMNHDGKQRRRPMVDVIDRILRGHTPDASQRR